MARVKDSGRGRHDKSERKQLRQFEATQQLKSINAKWRKWARCKVCGRKICVNNNAEREVRPFRRLGVAVCPWCTERSTRFYLIVRDLAREGDQGQDVVDALIEQAKEALE